MSPSHHGLVPGWFTSKQWEELLPFIDDLVSKPAGVLLIAIEVSPRTRNYPKLGFAVFDAEERKALRAALLKARRKRQAKQEAAKANAPLS